MCECEAHGGNCHDSLYNAQEQALQDSGTVVVCDPDTPWPSSVPRPAFDGRLFMSHLSSAALGHTLLSTELISSTQEFMRRHGAQLGSGAVMVADRQTSGKGDGTPHLITRVGLSHSFFDCP